MPVMVSRVLALRDMASLQPSLQLPNKHLYLSCLPCLNHPKTSAASSTLSFSWRPDNLHMFQSLAHAKSHARTVMGAAVGSFPLQLMPPPLTTPFDLELLSLYFPALLSLLIEPLLSLTDTAVVGRLGTSALAGVGLSTYSFGVISFLFSFLGIVTTAAVASASADSRNRDTAARAVAESAWVAIGAGLLAGAFVWNYAGSIVAAMGAKAEVAAASVAYSKARALGLVPGLLLFVVAGAFRGIKDTRTPAMIAAVGLVMNGVLDVVLALQLGWGVRGAAVATMATQLMQVSAGIWVLHRRGVFQLKALLQIPSRDRMLPLLTAGATLQARNLCVSAMMIWASMLALAINPAALAAHEVIRQLWILSSYVFLAMSVAVQPLVASSLSQQDSDGVAKAAAVTVRGMQLGTLVGLLLAAGVWLLGADLPRAFINDETVVVVAARVLPAIIITLPLEGMEKALEGSLLGAKQIPWVARNTIVTTAVCAAALFVTKQLDLGLLGIWVSVRLLGIGRLVGGVLRFTSPTGPFAPPQTGKTPKQAQ